MQIRPKQMILILATLLLLSLFSCKTKHKVIDREKVKENTSKQETEKEVKQTDIVFNNNIKTGSDIFKITDKTDVKLTQADPNKTITITDESGKKTIIQGANIIFKKTEIQETKKDSVIDKSIKTDKKTTQTDINLNENASKDNIKRTSESDVKTTSTWFWISLIVCGLGVLWFYIKK